MIGTRYFGPGGHLLDDDDLTFAEASQRAAATEWIELRSARRAQAAERGRSALEPYLYDPVGWVYRFVDTMDLAPYQEEALRHLVTDGKVALRGPRGLGKTTLLALTIIWVATTREATGTEWKIIVTSGSWGQITAYLWPEVKKWANRLDWDAMGLTPWRPDAEIQKTGLSLTHGAATSFSPSRWELIEGAHVGPGGTLLIVIDEAKAVAEGLWDSLEGSASNVDDIDYLTLAVSTPGHPSGKFFAVHRGASGTDDWWARHVRTAEALAAGRITERWVEQRAKHWGRGSSLFKQHVLGEFAADDEEAMIPVAWVEAAFDRWEQVKHHHLPAPTQFGVDIARMGGDRTVIASAHGQVVALRTLPQQDLAATIDDLATVMRTHPGARVMVDADGMGEAVPDVLRARGLPAERFKGAAAVPDWRDATGTRGAVNARSAAWWSIRELLDPLRPGGPTLALEPDDDLLGDLTAPRYAIDGKMRIKVESKDSIKDRIGRSPDKGDAVAYCLVGGLVAPPPEEYVMDAQFREQAAKADWTMPLPGGGGVHI